MINYKELKVEPPRHYFSSNVVREINTLLYDIDELVANSIDIDLIDKKTIYDTIDNIQHLLTDYDEPLVKELNTLRDKNDSLEREVNYQKEQLDKATKVIGLLALEAYDYMKRAEKNETD